MVGESIALDSRLGLLGVVALVDVKQTQIHALIIGLLWSMIMRKRIPIRTLQFELMTLVVIVELNYKVMIA